MITDAVEVVVALSSSQLIWDTGAVTSQLLKTSSVVNEYTSVSEAAKNVLELVTY